MKAIITLLIVGTSSLAAANPTSVRDHRTNLAVPAQVLTQAPGYEPQLRYRDRFDHDDRFDGNNRWYRDGRADRMRWRRPVLLAQNVQLIRRYNRDHRPLRIDLDARVGNLQKLRLDRDRGRMFIDSVVLVYADGHRQTVAVRRTLSARDPSIVIDLDHGGVTGMLVYGTTPRARGATFDVIGLRR